MTPELFLFDDRIARTSWRPFHLTRPIGELLFGCLLLRERAERVLGLRAAGHLAGASLLGFEEEGSPPGLDIADVPRDRPRLLLSSRVVPAAQPPLDVREPSTLIVDGEPVGWILPAGEPNPLEGALLTPAAVAAEGRRVELPGRTLRWPWSLVEESAGQIALDVPWLYGSSATVSSAAATRLGDHPVSVAEGTVIETGVVLDLRAGPIRLEEMVHVQAPARLVGPLFVGRGSLVFGGSLTASSIGPFCKVRGELDGSVVTGYCNKAHAGYLGHALLGRWVNLGALTTNSDLKNNYAPVRVRFGNEEVETGLLKVGCFLGDHVKTGVGTLFNTGSVVGAGSNLFGGSIPPRYVPPFSWGSGLDLVEFRLDRFIAAAEATMARRNVELTAPMRELLIRAWEATRSERNP